MSPFNHLGERVREGRLRLGMTLPEFAERVSTRVEVLERLESNRPLLEKDGLLPVLTRIADAIGEGIDVLMFADTSLFTVHTDRMKVLATRIIETNKWTNSVSVLLNVFQQIDQEYQATITEQASGALHFRGQNQALAITDERVFELVVKARNSHVNEELL